MNFTTSTKVLFLFTTMFLCNAQTTKTVTPKIVPAPAAFASSIGAWNPEPTVLFTKDGQYVLGFTEREAKAWRMPEGKLVYRFNTGMVKDDPKRGVLNYGVSDLLITADRKYIYAKGSQGRDFVMLPMDLETGKLLANGPLKDSLKSGEYQLKQGIRSSNEATFGILERFYSPKTSPLIINREKATSFEEGLTILGITSSPRYPGELIICFKQSFCGSRNFINKHLKESVKDVRKEQYRSNGCSFEDVHAARFNPTDKTATYLGNILKGYIGVDYGYNISALPSPTGDVVLLSGTDLVKHEPFQSMNTFDGTVLWKPSDVIKGKNRFKGFNDFGFAVFTVYDGDFTTEELTFDALTGKLISKSIFSPPLPKNYIYNSQWNVNVVINKLEDGSHSLGVYDASSGNPLLSLTDEAGAKQYASTIKSAYNSWEANTAAAQKAMQDSWDRQLAGFARESQELKAKNAKDEATHAANFKPCPQCNGTGVWITSGVAKAYSKTSYSEGRALDGSRTTIKSTESSSGGAWEHRAACLKCFGRGEIHR